MTEHLIKIIKHKMILGAEIPAIKPITTNAKKIIHKLLAGSPFIVPVNLFVSNLYLYATD